MYIVGYALASPTFGHFVHSYPPFKLMAIGLGVWVVAVLLSGWAPHFWVLVVARIFSGVGEASFQIVVPPYIDDTAPPSKRGLWLSIFYMAIPVGTAFGYAWGGVVATALSWRVAFYLEALPMIPLIFLVWGIPHGSRKRGGEAEGLGAEGASSPTPSLTGEGPVKEGGFHTPVAGRQALGVESSPVVAIDAGIDVDAELAYALGGGGEEKGGAEAGGSGLLEPPTPPPPAFLSELSAVLRDPLYLAVVLGYAGYTAVLAGMGSFGPTIVLGLGLFSDQSSASLYFGGAVSIAGAIGTPLGGYMLDRASRARRVAAAQAAKAAAEATAAWSQVTAHAASGLQAAEVATATAKAVLESPAGDGTAVPDGAGGEGEATADPEGTLLTALPQAVWATVLGTVCCMAGIMLGRASGALFFTLLGFGALCLCSTTAGVNQSIMAAVRPESRSFAIGLGTLLVHAFGDVPSPPVVGALADHFSPQTCIDSVGVGGVWRNRRTPAGLLFSALSGWLGATGPPPPPAGVGDDVTTCTRDAYGLQVTLVITLSWLIWPIVLWATAYFIVRKRGLGRAEATEAAAGPLVVSRYLSLSRTRAGSPGGEGTDDMIGLLSADRGGEGWAAEASPRTGGGRATGGQALAFEMADVSRCLPS
jgi:predicted MFS family arabinose efflux permease